MSDTPHTTRQCYKKVKLNAMLILVVKFGVYSMAKTRGARDIDESQQKAIIEDRKQGMHKELAQQFSISKSALTKLLKRWKRGYIKKKKPRCTFSVVDHNILRKSRSNLRFTTPDIAKKILSFGESNPSVQTIRHRLQVGGLHGRRPIKKPFIFVKNRKARIEWAQSPS